MTIRKRKQLSDERSGSAFSHGFTLMELLVVILLLAILCALLTVALSSAKARSARGVCASNQRQLMIAWQIYTSDHNETLVANDANSPQRIFPTWVIGRLDYSENNEYNIIDSYITGDRRSLLGGYIGSPRLVRCTGDRSTVRSSAGPLRRVRSLAMNAFVGHSKIGLAGVPFHEYRKTADLASSPPAGLYVFIEQLEDSVDDARYWLPMVTPERWEEYPGTAHGKGGVLAFSDGHVEFHKWIDARTPAQHRNSRIEAAWAPGSRDHLWLKARNTTGTLSNL